MTQDDRQSEHFIREVDEEFRRAQIKNLWDRFAPLVIGACVLVVLVTAGYRGWLWWQEREAARLGDQYLTAVEQLEAGNRAEAEATLNQLAAEGGGYGVLARLRLAGDKAAAGDNAAALAMFDAIAADGSAPQDMRNLARVRAGLLALDAGDFAGAASRVEGLAVAGNAWRHAAREILGSAAFASADMDAARTHFQAVQADAEAPPDLRSRAGLMLTLIEGQGPAAPIAPSPATAAPSNAAPTTALPIPAESPRPALAPGASDVVSPAPAPPVPVPAPAQPAPADAGTPAAPPSPAGAEAVQSPQISAGEPAGTAEPAQPAQQ